MNATDWVSKTSLIIAARRGYVEIVKYLIDHGAGLEFRNQSSRTALSIASIELKVFQKYTEIVKLLKEASAKQTKKLRRKIMENETELIAAVKSDDFYQAKYLIDNGADVNAKNYEGYTALMRAAVYNRTELAKYLIDNGADINEKNNNNNTALMCAARQNHTETTKFLIDNGADVNIKNEVENTALMIAEIHDHIETIKLLKK